MLLRYEQVKIAGKAKCKFALRNSRGWSGNCVICFFI